MAVLERAGLLCEPCHSCQNNNNLRSKKIGHADREKMKNTASLGDVGRSCFRVKSPFHSLNKFNYKL